MRFFPALLLALICLHPSFSQASQKLDLKPKEMKLADPGSATPLLYKSPAESESLNQSPKGSLQANTTCTDRFGTVIKQGDKAFEACLRNLQRSKTQNPNEKNPNSVGFTIGK